MDTPKPTVPPVPPRRWTLACELCVPQLRFDNTTVTAITVHWMTEHGEGDPRVDVIRLCVCGSTMDHTRETFRRSGAVKHHYWCPGCHRSERLNNDRVPAWQS